MALFECCVATMLSKKAELDTLYLILELLDVLLLQIKMILP